MYASRLVRRNTANKVMSHTTVVQWRGFPVIPGLSNEAEMGEIVARLCVRWLRHLNGLKS